MPEEPAPEIAPLVSLKEADRRRGGCGTFLIGAVTFGVLMVPGMVLLGYVDPNSKLNTEILVGSFVGAIAGAVVATRLFTKWRVARLDRRKPGPTSP